MTTPYGSPQEPTRYAPRLSVQTVEARLLNVWRRIPFVDTAAYADFVRAHGVPVTQDRGRVGTSRRLSRVAAAGRGGPSPGHELYGTWERRDASCHGAVLGAGFCVRGPANVTMGSVRDSVKDLFEAVERSGRVHAGNLGQE